MVYGFWIYHSLLQLYHYLLKMNCLKIKQDFKLFHYHCSLKYYQVLCLFLLNYFFLRLSSYGSFCFSSSCSKTKLVSFCSILDQTFIEFRTTFIYRSFELYLTEKDCLPQEILLALLSLERWVTTKQDSYCIFALRSKFSARLTCGQGSSEFCSFYATSHFQMRKK